MTDVHDLAVPRPAAPPADADGSASGLLRAAVESATVLQASEDFEAGILRALEIVGQAAGAECARLVEFQFSGTPPVLAGWTPLQQWARTPEFARRLADKPPLTFDEAPVWAGRILAGETLIKGCVEGAPDPAMRQSLRTLGVTGVLMVTVTVEGRPWGGLNFFGQAAQRAWTEMERDALVCAAKAFGFAVHRRRILLREREAEARAAAERVAELARANDALRRRDELLEAVAAVTRLLLEDDDLDAALAQSLRMLGERAGLSRAVLFMEEAREDGGRRHVARAEWCAPGVATLASAGLSSFDQPESAPAAQPLRGGQAWWMRLEDAPPAMRGTLARLGIRSTGSVPVRAGGRYLGCLVFDDCVAPREWPAVEIDTLAAAAHAIGAALRRKELEAEREHAAGQRARELAEVNAGLAYRGRLLAGVAEASQQLLGAQELERVLPAVLAVLGRAAGVERAGIMVMEEEAGSERGFGRLVAEWTAPGIPRQMDDPRAYRISLDGMGPLWDRVLSGGGVFPTAELPPGTRIPQEAARVHTHVGVPVWVGGRLWGALGFDHCTDAPLRADEELSVLRTGAAVLGAAVQQSLAARAVLREREDAARARAAELARTNQVLTASLDTLAGEADLDHFLVVCVERIREAAGARTVHMHSYDEAADTLSVMISTRADGTWMGPAPDDPPLLSRPYPADRSRIWERTLETRELVWSEVGPDGRLAQFPDVPPEISAWHRAYGTTGQGALALVTAGTPVAAMAFTFSGGVRPDPAQAERVQTLANQIALALRLIRLSEAAREAAVAREREDAARERAAELARANEALSGSLARLGEASDPAEVLSHVLLTLTTELDTPSSALWLYDLSRREAHLHLLCEDGRVIPGAESAHPNARRPSPIDLMTVAHRASTLGRRPFMARVDDEALDDAQRDYLRRMGVHALLGLPMVSGENVLGLITTRIVQGREVTPFQVEVAQSLAIQATLALQMSRLSEGARLAAVLEERNRIAREIHDTLAQGFTGIIWGLEGARQSMDPAARAPVDTALGLARTSLAEARRSLWALRPAPLDSDGLEPMLRRLVDPHRVGTAPVRLEVRGAAPRLQADVELNLTRLAQEAVSNAARHAGASSILVLLRADHDALSISVEDDGRGFEADALQPSASFGIQGMRERAARAGAQLAIDSRPGAGTRITVRVPLAPS